MDNSGGATYFSVLDNKNRVVHSGVTPQQVTLKSSSAPFRPAKYQVVYAGQDGVQKYDLNARINWWTAGNIVVGGVPGVAIDAGTGALWRLQPKVIGQVPSQKVVSNTTQGATLLAAYSSRGSLTPDVTTSPMKPASVQHVSFDSPGSTGQEGQDREPVGRF